MSLYSFEPTSFDWDASAEGTGIQDYQQLGMQIVIYNNDQY